jgi:PIN domain nuclease of toxin-antitoxin system
MRVLLDTHAFIWWVMNHSQLSDTARACIADSDNNVFLSTASVWEIVIKVNIGKLILPEPPKSKRYLVNSLGLCCKKGTT